MALSASRIQHLIGAQGIPHGSLIKYIYLQWNLFLNYLSYILFIYFCACTHTCVRAHEYMCVYVCAHVCMHRCGGEFLPSDFTLGVP